MTYLSDGRKIFIVLTMREGSKRIQDKCTTMLAGKELYEWVLWECLRLVKLGAEIYVSTSSLRYIDMLKSRKDVHVIKRPEALSGDDVTILPVLQHAITEMPCKDQDYVVHVDITKPMTRTWQIAAVIFFALGGDYDSVFTCKRFQGNFLNDPAICTHLKPEESKSFYHYGAVRLRTVETIKNADPSTWGEGKKHMYLPICGDWEMDIDEPWQLMIAEALLSRMVTK